MAKKAYSTLLIVILVGGLVFVGIAHLCIVHAESSVPKPSVPEFTVKFASHPYDVPTTYSIDPYTGENVTYSGYHGESNILEVTIKNQPFTSFNNDNEDSSFYYNIRVKGHFSEDWRELYRPSDGYPTQSDSEYTVISLGALGENGLSLSSGSIAFDVPSGGQMDFQVEAMIGYVSRKYVGDYGLFSYPYVFTGEESGWSSTQTVTVPDSSTPSPSPTSSIEPTQSPEPQQTELFPPLLIVAASITIVAVIAGLLVYFKKRGGRSTT